MAKVKFDDGTVINFQGNPSPDDISDAYENAKSLKGTPGNIGSSEGLLKKAMGIGREVLGPHMQAAGGLINTAGFGLPGLVMDKTLPQGAKDYLKPQGAGEQIGRTVGDIGGLFMPGGGPAAVGKMAGKIIPKATSPFLRGAGIAAAEQASMSPVELASGKTSLGREAAEIGGTALLGGAAIPVGKTIGHLFGGAKAAKGLAGNISKTIGSKFGEFNKRYDTVLKKSTDVFLNPSYSDEILGQIVNKADQFDATSAGGKYVESLFDRIPTMTAQKLHTLKQEIFEKASSFGGPEGKVLQDVYDKIDDVLGRKEVFGNAYKSITADFKPFIQDVQRVNKHTLDFQRKPTETKILSDKKLDIEDKESLKRLGGGNKFLSSIQAAKRARGIRKGGKKAAGYGAATVGGSLLLNKMFGGR